MPRVVHFEIHAEQPGRAIKFYRDLLGWEFTKWDGPQEYWLVTTGPDSEPGINGGLIQRRGPIDGQAVLAYVCTVETPTLDDYLQKAQAGGGTVVVPTPPQPWMPHQVRHDIVKGGGLRAHRGKLQIPSSKSSDKFEGAQSND